MTQRTIGPGGDFDEMFASVRRSAWRWECQGHYAVDEPELTLWQAGEPYEETDDDRAWADYIRGLRQAGATFERARMLTEPVTPYLEWMFATTGRNVELGEDVRWVAERNARALGMPTYDYYLLDNDRVAILRFDDQKVFTGGVLDDDPDTVERHRRWRDLVWQHAVRHQDYRSAEQDT